jgi:hypothetical protein
MTFVDRAMANVFENFRACGVNSHRQNADGSGQNARAP